jgi:two-component system chemotaxis sensor kinase CheA
MEKGLINEDQAKVMSDKESAPTSSFYPVFPPPKKSPTCPAEAWAWMWSKPTWTNSAASSISIPSSAKGSTIRIKLPLTLAIIPCQIVHDRPRTLCHPQVNLEELLRIPADPGERPD